MAKINKYRLPNNENYSVINSYYTGGFENGGCVCDNCGKLITNVAVIENSKKDTFNVGLDCASTLTNLNGLFSVEMDFAEVKKIRAKHNRMIKDDANITYRINQNGFLVIDFNKGNGNEIVSLDFASKYFKDYLNKLSNPEKLNYKPIELKLDVPFGKCSAKEMPNEIYNLSFENYNISLYQYIHTFVLYEGTEKEKIVTNYHFKFDIYLNSELIASETTYNYNQIISLISYYINKYQFEQFNA